jgi:hypothetical protein
LNNTTTQVPSHKANKDEREHKALKLSNETARSLSSLFPQARDRAEPQTNTMAASYAPPTTMSDLRGYVTGADSGFAARAESTVLLHVSHSHLRARFPEIRLDLHVECVA